MMEANPPPSYEMHDNNVNNQMYNNSNSQVFNNNNNQIPGSQVNPLSNPVGMAPSGNYAAPVVVVQASPRPSASQKINQGLFICLRELFGMSIFTYVACMGNQNMLSAGLIYMVLQASAEISSAGGLHLNPVISIAVVIAGKMQNPVLVIPMIFAQFLGCLLGAGFCRGSQTKEQFHYEDRYRPDHSQIYKVEEIEDLIQYCGGEMLLTCILVTVFLRLFPLTTKSLPSTQAEVAEVEKRKYIHALFVGLTIVALSGVVFGAYFVGVMNPFRAFGPMAIRVIEDKEEDKDYGSIDDNLFNYYPRTTPSPEVEKWKGHWIYWVGPFLGGIIAGVVDRLKGSCSPVQVQ